MFYEVRVFDPSGNLKKKIPSDYLTKQFWEKFYQNENEKSFGSVLSTKIPSWVKEKLDLEFPDVGRPELS